tara:strand:- start:1859 stop:2650 length:792 start_codon:yes stop_codon:yes gene_type:complete
MNTRRIAIIGCGNLGSSIIEGLLEKGIDPKFITATRRDISKLKQLQDKGVNCTTDNRSAVANADVLIFALKPYTILEVLSSLKPQLDPEKQIIVSLASGVNISELEHTLSPNHQIFRAMPNTAAAVGESMTCIATNSTDEQKIKYVRNCFDSIGESIIIDESLMDAATVIGACGVAFVLRFMRSMTQGGIQIGFDAKTAGQIVAQTMKGAAQLITSNGNHPELEIDKVTTPKGCTISGLNEMEHNGFSSALIKGITTSFEEIS